MASSPRTSSSGSSEPAPIVLVGIGGLSIDYLSEEETPALLAFMRASSAANLVEKTTGETTCPSSAWLTIGAGVRTAASEQPCWNPSVQAKHTSQDSTGASISSMDDVSAGQSPHSTAQTPTSSTKTEDKATEPYAHITRWDRIREISQNTPYGSFTPALSLLTQASGVKALTVGTGAALAVADRNGNVNAKYVPGPDYASADNPDTPAKLLHNAYAGENLIIADLGNLRFPQTQLGTGEEDSERPNAITLAARSAFEGVPALPASSHAALQKLDAAFASFTSAMREILPSAQIMLVSTGEAQETTAHLGIFSWEGAQGMAYSPSTRTRGLVQLTDIAPTLLAHYGLNIPSTLTGSTIEQIPGSDATASLASLATRAHEVRPLVGSYYIAFYGLWVLVSLLALRALRRHNGALSSGLRQCLLLVAGVPAASFLVNLMPWWLAPSPALALFSGILVIACVLAVVAQMPVIARYRYGALYFFSAVTLVTIAGEVIASALTHSYGLQLASLTGSHPQVGARFYGLGNVPFALFAASGLAIIAYASFRYAARPRHLAAFLGVTSLLLVLVDATPSIGADFGGSPGILVGACALYFFVGQRTWKWWHIFPVALIAAIPPFAFATFDYLQPAGHRSHLGRFINSALNGGAADIVARKLSALAFGLPWFVALGGIVVLVAVVAGVYVFLLRAVSRHSFTFSPTPLQASALALACMLLVSLAINDSGIAIPLTGISFVSPLWLYAASHPSEVSSDSGDGSEGSALA